MDKRKFQIVYGVVLIMVGIGVFFRVSYVMPKIESINYFANATLIIKLSFYCLGGLVILAGAMKIFKIWNNTGDM